MMRWRVSIEQDDGLRIDQIQIQGRIQCRFRCFRVISSTARLQIRQKRQQLVDIVRISRETEDVANRLVVVAIPYGEAT